MCTHIVCTRLILTAYKRRTKLYTTRAMKKKAYIFLSSPKVCKIKVKINEHQVVVPKFKEWGLVSTLKEFETQKADSGSSIVVYIAFINSIHST